MADIEINPPAINIVEIVPLGAMVQGVLASKAPLSHNHLMSHISGLGEVLDQKTAEIDGAITAHLATEDPHPQYISSTELATHATGTGAGGHIPGGGLTNSSIALDAQISWSKISKEGASAGDVGAATSNHSHVALPTISATAPAAPAAGARWRDTGDNLIWFWNGSYWLSEQLFRFSIAVNGLTTTGYTPGGLPTSGDYDIWFESFEVAYNVSAGTIDASNKWTFNLIRESNGSSTTESTIEMNYQTTGEKNAIKNNLGIHRDVSALNSKYFRMNIFKSGSPPTLTHSGMIFTYRIAKP